MHKLAPLHQMQDSCFKLQSKCIMILYGISRRPASSRDEPNTDSDDAELDSQGNLERFWAFLRLGDTPQSQGLML